MPSPGSNLRALLGRERPLVVPGCADALNARRAVRAFERAGAYAEAGADLVFVEAPTTLEALAERYAPQTMEAIRDA